MAAVHESSALVTQAPALPARREPRYGPFARWLRGKLFDPVPFPSEQLPRLQQAAQATPVYVLRSSSLLHLLYFNYTFGKLGLPLARAATGLGYRIFAPFARWYLGGPQIKGADKGEVANVVEAVKQGEAALVFLRQPRTLPSAVSTLADPFPALVELQRAQPDKPIALVPLTFLWRKRPKRLGGSWRDFFLGDPAEPAATRTFLGYLGSRKGAYAKVGELVLLSDVDAMNRDSEPARVARRVRGWVHHHLARETRVVTGPPLKPPARVIDETLRDLQLRRTLA